VPLLCGQVVPDDKNNNLSGYKALSIIMISCSVVGVLMGLYVFMYDMLHSRILISKNPKKRVLEIEAEKAKKA